MPQFEEWTEFQIVSIRTSRYLTERMREKKQITELEIYIMEESLK